MSFTRVVVGMAVLPLVIASPCCAQTFLTAFAPSFENNLHRFDGETETFTVNAGGDSAFQGVTILNDIVLVADYRQEQIQRFLPDGTLLAPFANFSAPTFLESDSNGNVYTTHASIGPAVATRFDSLGNITGTFDSTVTNSFFGIDADAMGNVYVVGPGELQKFASDGTYLGATAITGGPRDISIDEQDQRLYLADEHSSTDGIQIFDISGVLPTFMGTIPTPIDATVFGLHYSPELGTLFAVDFGLPTNNPRGLQLALDGSVLATYPPTDTDLVFDIVYRVPEPSSIVLLVGLVLAAAARSRGTIVREKVCEE